MGLPHTRRTGGQNCRLRKAGLIAKRNKCAGLAAALSTRSRRAAKMKKPAKLPLSATSLPHEPSPWSLFPKGFCGRIAGRGTKSSYCRLGERTTGLMKNNPLPRLDEDSEIRRSLLAHCRLAPGDVWTDSQSGHRVACADAANEQQVASLMDGTTASLAVHDPPYNLVAFEKRVASAFADWSERWVRLSDQHLSENASLYIWLGADQNHHFQPLPQFMLMMEQVGLFDSRSLITMRNQRGYGTQKNWMAVRQELLYYTKGRPDFEVQYTEIPKILRGYYKNVGGRTTENLERSKSENIRAANVWVDVQQVFYRMEENVSGCYAQKPLKAIERIIKASSRMGDCVFDWFSHSGTTLLACEIYGRRCFTADIDPIYCEISIRRLEHFRRSGRLGWQNGHPFEDVLSERRGALEVTDGVTHTSRKNGRLF